MNFMEDIKFKNAELLIERIIDLQQYFEENEKIKTDLRLSILIQIFKKKMIFVQAFSANYWLKSVKSIFLFLAGYFDKLVRS